LEKLAVAAFNTGEGNVARAQDRAAASGEDPAAFSSVEPYLPPQTKAYVERVVGYRQDFEKQSPIKTEIS
jgi:soluble lytic murein transglycosylase-like protein